MIAEIALAVVLVIGCTVMVRSFIRLQHVDLGFKPDHVLTFGIELPHEDLPGHHRRRVLAPARAIACARCPA